jgi:hypothetical protein
VVALAAQWGQGTGISFTQRPTPLRYQRLTARARRSSEF